jgi:hypothetical protein
MLQPRMTKRVVTRRKMSTEKHIDLLSFRCRLLAFIVHLEVHKIISKTPAHKWVKSVCLTAKPITHKSVRNWRNARNIQRQVSNCPPGCNWKSILILSFHLHVCIQVVASIQDFDQNFVCTSQSSHAYSVPPSPHSHFHARWSLSENYFGPENLEYISP